MSRLLRPQDLRTPNQRAANADRAEVPVAWGPGAFQPSQPQGVGFEQGRRVSLPGEDFPPAGAIPVDVIGEADIAQSTSATLITITVPDTYRFRIQGIGFGAEDESALRFLSWTLNARPPAAPIYGYVNMPAGIGSIQYPSWVFIALGLSVVFTAVATNNSLFIATYHYFARVQGWFYSEKES